MIDLKNESEKVEIEEPNENTHKAQKCETAISVIREYKDVIRTKRKNIICNTYQQDRVFKWFKENEEFKSMVATFKVNKNIMLFKMNNVKLIHKFPKLMESSLAFNFLKYYFRNIIETCNENISRFATSIFEG